jgi:hypothetical protein
MFLAGKFGTPITVRSNDHDPIESEVTCGYQCGTIQCTRSPGLRRARVVCHIRKFCDQLITVSTARLDGGHGEAAPTGANLVAAGARGKMTLYS